MEKISTTLIFLIREHELCLAMKKRGFGMGNWNGYGGKVDPPESLVECAVRETFEESGVVVTPVDLEQVAFNEFFLASGTHIEVTIYFARRWKGEPFETEEMSPKWFSFNSIPYETMWADDPYWLPRCILGEKIRGRASFLPDEKTITEMEWQRVSSWD